MKSIRRWFLPLMVLALVIGLAACATPQDTPAAPELPAGVPADAPGQQAETPDRWAERIQIELATTNVFEGYDYIGGDPWARFIQDKFNIEITFINLPFDVWHSNPRLWIMTGEMPDVLVWDYAVGHTEGAMFVEQGTLRRLPEGWEQQWPHLASSHESTILGPKLDETFDGTYFLPRARFHFNNLGDPLPTHESLFIRRDWLEAVNFPVRPYYTIDEVMEMTRLFRDYDPGNLGPMLLPMTASPARSAVMFLGRNFAHWDTFYRGPDGSFQWGVANPRTREGLIRWYEAYSEGLLDQEFYLISGFGDRDMFSVAGRAGVVWEAAGTHNVPRRFYTYQHNFPDRDAHNDAILATLLGSDGNYHQRDLMNFWGAFVFSPRMPEAALERVLDILDWFASPEGNTASNMGVPGLDFEWGADGNPISLLGPDEQLMGAPDIAGVRNPSMGNKFLMPILQDDFQFDNPNLDQIYRDMSMELYTNRVVMSTPESFTITDWDLWMHDSDIMRRVPSTSTLNDAFANMVVTATSMEHFIQMYEDWMASQMFLIQPALDELNSLFN